MSINFQKPPELVSLEQKLKDFPTFVADYIHHKRQETTLQTAISYLYDLSTFFDWMGYTGLFTGSKSEVPYSLLEKMPVKQAMEYKAFLKDIEYIKNTKTEEKAKYKETTINRKLTAVKDLFNYLCNIAETDNLEPLMTRNVMAKIKLIDLKVEIDKLADNIASKILWESEFDEFIDFIRYDYIHRLNGKTKEVNFHNKNCERDVALISLILDSGLRAFEVVGLNLSDISFHNNKISVLGKGNKAASVPFGDVAKRDLQEYLSVRTNKYKVDPGYEPVFLSSGTGPKGEPSRLTKRQLQNIVEKYAKAFGKPNISVHKLRHSYATAYHEKNNDIAKLSKQLRHADPKTTMIYHHVNDDQRVAAAKRVRG
ncbi:tyrosine recombinase XerS [Brevibacillus centrosporus]|uniref:tyrosine recombinase XerS n=1 Tax=Brevibacillus centrosporus TaxID=54910 RepID=UPI0011420EBC|nr:tyrosine recombinase XerS [Brevibacillus centrosporus]MEC2133362.1 tyrosine recombinase XerS [Brevibacillus centrosporus]GED34534.1 tyrosine recombinase XerS [Brevibacillus centrosporus]